MNLLPRPPSSIRGSRLRAVKSIHTNVTVRRISIRTRRISARSGKKLSSSYASAHRDTEGERAIVSRSVLPCSMPVFFLIRLVVGLQEGDEQLPRQRKESRLKRNYRNKGSSSVRKRIVIVIGFALRKSAQLLDRAFNARDPVLANN